MIWMHSKEFYTRMVAGRAEMGGIGQPMLDGEPCGIDDDLPEGGEYGKPSPATVKRMSEVSLVIAPSGGPYYMDGNGHRW